MTSMAEPLIASLARRIHLNVRRQLHRDVVAAGFEDLSPIHLYAFQLPGPDGLRPTELAQRINMTKQATNHLLRELEDRGYIERTRSAHDGRAKTITLTPRGAGVMRVMQRSSRSLEREWARSLGKDTLEQLRTTLVGLNEIWPGDP